MQNVRGSNPCQNQQFFSKYQVYLSFCSSLKNTISNANAKGCEFKSCQKDFLDVGSG